MRSLLLVKCSATVIQPLTIIEMFGLEVWTVGFKHLPLYHAYPIAIFHALQRKVHCPKTTLEIRTIFWSFGTPKIQNFKYER